MPNAATLPLLLKRLALPSMYNNWEPTAEQAEKNNWTYPEYLTALSDQEAASRQQKRIQRHIKEAKLSPGKTLEAYDFNEAASVNAAQISALANNVSWVNSANNLMIFGPSGVGKTHLASAIAYRLIQHGIRVLFISTTSLVQKLQVARAEYKLQDMINKLSRYPLLVLDDFGYVKKDEAETNVLFELIAQRYETNSLLITSNQAFSEWDQIFPDTVMAVAAIDRLVHHATIINIQDESYRKKKAKQKAGGEKLKN